MRAPYQVLIFPYIKTDDSIQYAIFNRSDYGYWQGIAGGGEDEKFLLNQQNGKRLKKLVLQENVHIYN